LPLFRVIRVFSGWYNCFFPKDDRRITLNSTKRIIEKVLTELMRNNIVRWYFKTSRWTIGEQMKRPHLFLSNLLVLSLVVTTVSFISCTPYTTGLQKTKARADETAVIAALRTIGIAQRAHAMSKDGEYGTFEELVEGGFLDQRFNSEAPEVQGYVLTMKVSEKEFGCNADAPGSTDPPARHFYIDSTDSQIHVNNEQQASAQDPVL
jgi:hypothetical protein